MKRHIKYNNTVSIKLAWLEKAQKRKSLRLYETQIIPYNNFVQSIVANILKMLKDQTLQNYCSHIDIKTSPFTYVQFNN